MREAHELTRRELVHHLIEHRVKGAWKMSIGELRLVYTKLKLEHDYEPEDGEE